MRTWIAIPDGKHVCAAPCCNVMVPNEMLMCRPHWKQLPYAIQRKVNDAWRHVHRDRKAYVDAVAEAVLAIQKLEAQGDLL